MVDSLAHLLHDGVQLLHHGAEGCNIFGLRPCCESLPFGLYLCLQLFRDVLCLLPYQLDDSTLTIGAYIQTRNILEDVQDAGRYRISFPGLTVGAGAVTVYDPLYDRVVAADIGLRAGALSVTLTLTDCPVWMTLRNVDGPRGGGPLTATLDYDPYVQRVE